MSFVGGTTPTENFRNPTPRTYLSPNCLKILQTRRIANGFDPQWLTRLAASITSSGKKVKKSGCNLVIGVVV
nr:MAG TPA: hypothetical protein [Caudoviricetes sp.]